MKVYLLTSYHVDKDPKRDKELKTCLTINSKIFDHVTLLGEQPFDFIGWDQEKIEWCGVKDRPFFTDFLNAIQCIGDSNGIYVIANADIFFKKYFLHAVKDFYAKFDNKYMLALSRWDVHNFVDENNFTEAPFLRPDSADCWIIKGAPRFITAPFKMGVPGCDNVFPFAANQAGYKVVNPSHEIKIYHLHISNVRNYSLPNGEVTERYGPPYLMVEPCHIKNIT